jgi:tetratricopeptide (TPR) repeat protein
MRKMILPLTVFILLCSSLVASAATLVIPVNNSALACYRAAKDRDTTALGVCAYALTLDLSVRDRAATLINRSALRILKGDFAGGIADCDASIATYGGLGEAHLNRGVALRETGRPQEALLAIETSIKVGLKRPELGYYDRALTKEDLGDIKGAYHDLKKALEVAPDFREAADQLKRYRLVSAGA